MATLGDLMVRIGADASGLQAALKDSIEALEKAGTRVNQVGAAISKAFDKLGAGDAAAKTAAQMKSVQNSFELLEKSYKDGKISAADYAKAQEALKAKLEQLSGVAKPVAQQFDKLNEAFRSIGISRSQFQITSQINELRANLDYLKRAYDAGQISAVDYAKAHESVKQKIEQLTAATDEAGKATDKLKDHADHTANRFQHLGMNLEMAGMRMTAALTVPIVGFGTAAITTASNIEMLQTGLISLTGSAEKGAEMMGRLKEFAATTPFEFPELVETSKRMMALGFTADEVIPSLRSIGDAVAALGGGKELIDRVTIALGQMKAKGTVQAEEMRQLAQAGIPAWEMLAKTLNVTVAEAMKMVERRAVDATTGINAVLTGMNEKFGGMMQNMMVTLKGMWSNLKDQLTFTLDETGKVLVPISKQIVGFLADVLNFVKDVAAGFASLPEPIQKGIIGLAALLAAIGPVLLGAGALATTITSLSAVLGMVGGLAGILTLATPLAIAFGAAIAAWAIYEAITTISQLNREMEQLEGALARGKQATKEQADQIAFLETALKRMGKELPTAFDDQGKILTVAQYIDELKKAVEKAGKSTDEFRGGWVNTGKSLTGFTTTVKDGITIITRLGEETKKAGKSAEDQLKALGEAAKKAEANYKLLLIGFQNGTVGLAELTRAYAQMERAQNAADPSRLQKALDQTAQDEARLREETIKLAEKISDLDKQVQQSSRSMSAAFGKALNDMRTEAAKEIKITVPLSARLPQEIQDAIRNTKELEEAARRLGIQHNKTAEQLTADYERIRASGRYAAYEILRAEKAALEATIREHRAVYGQIPQEHQKRLEEVEGQLGTHKGKYVDIWREMGRQISTIMTDLSKNVADKLFNLFRESPEEKRLKEQEVQLRASLVTRAQEWESYQQEVAQQLEQIRERHAQELEREAADLREALAERETQYEEYAADIETQIEAARAKYARIIDEETAELQARLDERIREYESYKLEVGQKIEDITAKHREQLEEELDDLRDQLRDKTEAYEDFVEDANLRLSRIGEDLADNIEDQTRRSKRGMEDKQKSFRRDEEDTLRRIARLKRAGKKESDEEIQDLRRQLSRKREDLDEYNRRAQEDLTDYVEEARRNAQRQEADVQTSLERRARDHGQYLSEWNERVAETEKKHRDAVDREVGDLRRSLDERRKKLDEYYADTAAKIEEVTRKYNEAADKEEAKLRESLARKTAEWEKYKRDVAQKLEDLTSKHAEELAEQETDLQRKLADKLEDYEKFKLGVFAKLEEIAAKHKSIWGEIGDFIYGQGGVIDQIGKAFSRLVIENTLGKYLESLMAEGGVLSRLGKAVSGALGGLFGGGAGSVPIPTGPPGMPGGGPPITTPGGPPSAPGGATPVGGGGGIPGGGLGGTIDAITGAISAGANVVTAIWTVRQEGTLNQIERNTAAASIHLLHTLEQANEYWPSLTEIRTMLGEFIYPMLQEIRDGLNNIVGLVVNLEPGEDSKRVADALVRRLDFRDTTTSDRLLETNSKLREIWEAIDGARRELTSTISAKAELIIGQLGQIAQRLPSTLEKILDRIPLTAGLGGIGSAIGGGLSNVAGAFASPIGTIFASLFGNRGMSRDLGHIEENTRFSAIALVGKDGVIDTLRAYLPWLEELGTTARSEMQAAVTDILSTLQGGITDRLLQIDDALRQAVYPALEEIVDRIGSLAIPQMPMPAMAAAGPASIELVVRLEGGSVRDREVAESVLSQINRQLRRVGQGF